MLVHLFPAFGSAFGAGTAAHELGHAFGLPHDFRRGAYIMSYGGDESTRLSRCAAEWLDVHPHFNPDQSIRNATSNAKTTIEMLPSSLVLPPNTIRLRFKVTDPAGIHQVQLVGVRKDSLIACQRLNGNPSHAVVIFLPPL